MKSWASSTAWPNNSVFSDSRASMEFLARVSLSSSAELDQTVKSSGPSSPRPTYTDFTREPSRSSTLNFAKFARCRIAPEHCKHFLEVETRIEENSNDRLFGFGARFITIVRVASKEVSSFGRNFLLRGSR